jgi:hypothetical protein
MLAATPSSAIAISVSPPAACVSTATGPLMASTTSTESTARAM